jgi:N-ethylmaleimide reductase
MNPSPSLFSPLEVGALSLPNRVVMAPLTRNRAVEGNVPSPFAPTYYAQRASAGLIVTEATQISPQGVGYPRTPGIHDAQQVAGWKRVTDAVHARGGRIVLQLWHVGRISHPSLQPDGGLPVAPSAIRPEGMAFTWQGLQPFETPRALALEEIPDVVEQYRHAAANAGDAGFDGVEVHAANGYLLDQFLRDGANRREDRYGGSVEHRARLMLEVVRAAIGVWGRQRVGVRISPENPFNDMRDSNPQATFEHVAAELSAMGIAYLHVLQGTMEPAAAGAPGVDYAKLRARFHGIYMANCGFDRARAIAAVAAGAADLIAFGRPFISNPDLPRRLEHDLPLAPWDESTFYAGEERGYTDYPALED